MFSAGWCKKRPLQGLPFEPQPGGSMTADFIRERQYLKAVTQKTLIWYGCSFKAFENALEGKEAVQRRIIELRQRNVSPVSINSYVRCINVYFMWLHKEHGKELVRIPKLKEEQKILATLNADQIRRLMQFKPRGKNEAVATLLHCLSLMEAIVLLKFSPFLFSTAILTISW